MSKSDERVVESALHQTRAAPPSRRPVPRPRDGSKHAASYTNTLCIKYADQNALLPPPPSRAASSRSSNTRFTLSRRGIWRG